MPAHFYRAIPVFLALLAPSPAPADDESQWADRLSISADIRLRYEAIQSEGLPDQERGRYRVRLGLAADVYEQVRLVFSLATGADNPVSRNVTFGDSFGPDDFGLELAYVDWTLSDAWRIFGGKMKNPLVRAGGAPLIYDSDLNPEGIAAVFESGAWFANLAAFFVEESALTDDAHLYHVQGGFQVEAAGPGELRVGAGWFTYTNTIGKLPFFFGLPRGNTVDGNDRYVFDYRNSEVFLEYGMQLGDWPLQWYGQLTRNHDIGREDTAWAVGVRLGRAKKRGSMDFAWTYQDIEADAVIGAFNDSDFGGGGTDASGHILEANFMLRERIALAATLYLNEVGAFQAAERDYRRLQLDVEFTFD
jgi:hypothetical protein